MTEDEKFIMQQLLEEKKLVFGEKMQLLKTVKSIMGLLFPFLAFMLDVALKAEGLFLIIPIILSSVAFFLLSNENTLNLIYEYLAEIDNRINTITNQNLPYYQITIGDLMADMKFNITKDYKDELKFPTPNGYYLFTYSLIFFIVPIYVLSIFKGNEFLLNLHWYYWNCIYVFICILFLLALVYALAIYGTKYKDIRKKIVSAKIQQITRSSSRPL